MSKATSQHKQVYKEIIQGLGDTLADYNVGAWALFRDQMATEMSNQFIFGGQKKPDESLLLYSIPAIQRTNKIVKGQIKITDRPSSDFTYYTPNGAVKSIEGKAILPNPMEDRFMDTTEDYHEPKYNYDSTSKYNPKDGKWHSAMYNDAKKSAETARFVGSSNDTGLDGTVYTITNPSIDNNKNTLLDKTAQWFSGTKKDYISKRFSTLISRFHSDLQNQTSIEDLENQVGLQAYSKDYGLSRGNNVLKLNHKDSDNPYCRVWTWHNQYHRLVNDTIRPFPSTEKGSETLEENYNWKVFRSPGVANFPDGGTRLRKYGVMYDNDNKTNGLVNITPSVAPGSEYDAPGNISVKKCMFSIENLAWKGTFTDYGENMDEFGLSREQKGPLGGRIMWFPPYDLKFNESVQANWQSNEFIGRGEPIYTYANTVRSGTLSFKLLIDHPAILDYWERRDEVYNGSSSVDDVESKEQELLRFFAGCSVLKAKQLSVPEKINNEDDDNDDDSVDTEDNYIQFVAFFPNNYSGEDYFKDKNPINKIDPIEYLLNGVGANRVGKNGEWVDLPTNVTDEYYYGSQRIGGYEMRPGIGVSVIKQRTDNDEICTIQEKSSNGENNNRTLVKMCGSNARKGQYNQTSWHNCRYYYRADMSKLNEIIPNSYIDTESFCLNSTGYEEALAELNITKKSEIDRTYSLTELYVATKGDKDKIFDGLYNENKVKKLQSILNGDKGALKVSSCIGGASGQGFEQRNEGLAKKRWTTMVNWVQKNLGVSSDRKKNILYNYPKEEGNASAKLAKMHRFAIVRISYGGTQTSDGSETNVNDDDVLVVNMNTESNNTVTEETTAVTTTTTKSYRYDDEARFFTKLTEKDPFITKLISDRIKNFDPVFHSMSPEGYNARLTFLQQCTRQGPTIGGGDGKIGNANNLAFGRPPVCVLRLGDFYNTKIIITGLQIDPDPLMWDLNQEGIGVMPMITNIQISFNFIGGSDLGGPIQRLQNATSFNYYANTGVYDNRAENIEIKGDDIKFKAFDPYITDFKK